MNRTALPGLVLSMTVSGAAMLAGPPPAPALRDWDRYVKDTEARIERELAPSPLQLAAETLARAAAARARDPRPSNDLLYVAEVATSGKPGMEAVEDGLRHHWLGAVFVPGVGVDDVIAFVQDYDRHAGSFEDVVASKLLKRNGEEFDVLLRLRRTKVVTVYYDTTHHVVYRRHGDGSASSRSVATRIVELEPPDKGFKEKAPAHDRGFMWRLNSYWRFVERSGGVVVECESVSLSRGIPWIARWLVAPFVSSVPRESLERTLQSIKKGTVARARAPVQTR